VTIEDLVREVKAAYRCGVTGAELEVVVLKEVADVKRWLSDLHLTTKFSIRQPHCFKFARDADGNVGLYARYMAWRVKSTKPWKHIQYINDALFQKALRGRGGIGEPARVIPSPFPDNEFYQTLQSIEESAQERNTHMDSWQQFFASVNALKDAQRSACTECVRLYDVFRSKKSGGHKPSDEPEQERQRRLMNAERLRAESDYIRHQQTHTKHTVNRNTYTSCIDADKQEPQPFWTNYLPVLRSASGEQSPDSALTKRFDALPTNNEMGGKHDLLPNLLDDREVNDEGLSIEPSVLLATSTFVPTAKNVRVDDYVLMNTTGGFVYEYPFFCLARVLEVTQSADNGNSKIVYDVKTS
jgi:hypothetical protein